MQGPPPSSVAESDNSSIQAQPQPVKTNKPLTSTSVSGSAGKLGRIAQSSVASSSTEDETQPHSRQHQPPPAQFNKEPDVVSSNSSSRKSSSASTNATNVAISNSSSTKSSETLHEISVVDGTVSNNIVRDEFIKETQKSSAAIVRTSSNNEADKAKSITSTPAAIPAEVSDKGTAVEEQPSSSLSKSSVSSSERSSIASNNSITTPATLTTTPQQYKSSRTVKSSDNSASITNKRPSHTSEEKSKQALPSSAAPPSAAATQDAKAVEKLNSIVEKLLPRVSCRKNFVFIAGKNFFYFMKRCYIGMMIQRTLKPLEICIYGP